MITMLSTYFRYRLEALGYEDMEVEFSLNYCQGDGVAFYGALHSATVRTLAKRLLSGPAIAAVVHALDKGSTLRIQKYYGAGRYCHYNTMEVFVWYGGGLTKFEEDSLEIFANLIQDDVRTVSRQLESEGYKILEAAVGDDCEFGPHGKYREARRFKMGRFELTITEHEPNHAFFHEMEKDDFMDFCRSLVNGEVRYFDLKVSVLCDDFELGTAYLCDSTALVKNPPKVETYGGYRQQLVAEACEAARETLNRLTTPKAA